MIAAHEIRAERYLLLLILTAQVVALTGKIMFPILPWPLVLAPLFTGIVGFLISFAVCLIFIAHSRSKLDVTWNQSAPRRLTLLILLTLLLLILSLWGIWSVRSTEPQDFDEPTPGLFPEDPCVRLR